jgi:hypothetical protein
VNKLRGKIGNNENFWILTLHVGEAVCKSKSKAVLLHIMEVLVGRGGIAPTHSRPQY